MVKIDWKTVISHRLTFLCRQLFKNFLLQAVILILSVAGSYLTLSVAGNNLTLPVASSYLTLSFLGRYLTFSPAGRYLTLFVVALI